MATVNIRTNDSRWAARNDAQPGTIEGCVSITVHDVQPDTFAGQDMIRFTLDDVPSDWGNRYCLLPARYLASA